MELCLDSPSEGSCLLWGDPFAQISLVIGLLTSWAFVANTGFRGEGRAEKRIKRLEGRGSGLSPAARLCQEARDPGHDPGSSWASSCLLPFSQMVEEGGAPREAPTAQDSLDSGHGPGGRCTNRKPPPSATIWVSRKRAGHFHWAQQGHPSHKGGTQCLWTVLPPGGWSHCCSTLYALCCQLSPGWGMRLHPWALYCSSHLLWLGPARTRPHPQ